MSEINYVELINWNKSRLHGVEVRSLQEALNAAIGAGLKEDGDFGPATLTAVLKFQASITGMIVDGKVGRQTLMAIRNAAGEKGRDVDPNAGSRQVEFDEEQVGAIMRGTILHESAGRRNPFAAQNRDLEYEGWFDRPARDEHGAQIHPKDRTRRHWASKYNEDGGAHIGLSWGIIQFTQDSSLGDVLQEAARLDREAFNEIMGAGDALLAHQLLQVVTSPGARKPNKTHGARSPRVQPVSGADLWRTPWTGRFDLAADHPAFQKAQIAVAAEKYLWPAIQLVLQYGAPLPSQEDIAVALDLCVHLGPGKLPKEDRWVSEKGFESFKRQGKGAVRWWEQAVLTHRRGVVAAEVINLMAKSERARRETIMRATDERMVYDREQLKRMTPGYIKQLALSAPIKGT